MNDYQMDIFDMLDDAYPPIEHPSEHQPVTLWFCKKCGKVVGAVADGDVQTKKDMCVNGHKVDWSNSSIRYFERTKG